MSQTEARKRALDKYHSKFGGAAGYSREWRKNNPEKAQKQNSRYKQSHPEIVKKCRKNRYLKIKNNFPEQYVLHYYKYGAKKRGLIFEISENEFNKTIFSPCFYCGIAPNPTNGIDRVDNSVGYVSGNIVPCCSTCNRAKRKMSKDDFVVWVMRVSDHLEKTGQTGIGVGG